MMALGNGEIGIRPPSFLIETIIESIFPNPLTIPPLCYSDSDPMLDFGNTFGPQETCPDGAPPLRSPACLSATSGLGEFELKSSRTTSLLVKWPHRKARDLSEVCGDEWSDESWTTSDPFSSSQAIVKLELRDWLRPKFYLSRLKEIRNERSEGGK